MHAGSHYSLKEILTWTRRDLFVLFLISIMPVLLYKLLDLRWLVIPWVPIALIGTAVAFVIGFKNNATYGRLWEARQIWGAIVNLSRSWGMLVHNYPVGGTEQKYQEQLID